jgi:uncharacterized membrane protein YczE
VRLLELAVGLVLLAGGVALYVCADLGAGPRDALMLRLATRYGLQLWLVGTGLELLALAGGVILGGRAGVGTLVYALAITPGDSRLLRATHSTHPISHLPVMGGHVKQHLPSYLGDDELQPLTRI